ncbi:cerberus [Ctenodactylus gundi]
MYLLLLKMLVLLPLGKASQPSAGGQSQRAVSFTIPERNGKELSMGNHEEGEDEPDSLVAVPHLVGSSLEEKDQRHREKMLSRFGRFWKKPERELHRSGDVEIENFPRVSQSLPRPMEEIKVEKSPLQEEARKFWHHFMLRKGPASQGVILPIKSHEVHRETCRTVPFIQTITHEDCEKVVVQNNLCFGKCGSAHFPGTAPHPYTFCSHCEPAKFTTMHLQLNCTGPAPVVKVVMQVEECQCKVKTEHRDEHLLHADSQDSFIPGVSTCTPGITWRSFCKANTDLAGAGPCISNEFPEDEDGTLKRDKAHVGHVLCSGGVGRATNSLQQSREVGGRQGGGSEVCQVRAFP